MVPGMPHVKVTLNKDISSIQNRHKSELLPSDMKKLLLRCISDLVVHL